MTSIQTREQVPRVLAAARPRPLQPAGAQAAFGFRDVMQICRKRKWLIIITLAVSVVLAGSGTFVWARFWPGYSSEALVVLQPPARTVLSQAWREATTDAIERYKKTNVVMVKTVPVLKEALARPEIQRTNWYKHWTAGTAGDVNPAIMRLQKKLRVTDVPDSEHIRIGMSMASNDSGDIQELPTIINAVARAFVEFANQDATSERDRQITSLAAEKTKSESILARLNDEIRLKLSQMAVPTMARQLDTLAFELQDLTRRRTEIQDVQDDVSTTRESILAQQRSGAPGSNPAVLQMLDADFILRQMEAQLQNMLARREVLESTYGPDHPNRKTHETLIGSLRAEIEEYREELSQTIMESQVTGLDQQWLANSRKLQAIEDRLSEIMSKRRDLSQALKEIENAEATKMQLEQRLARLDDRLQELSLLRKDDPALLRPAYVPIDYEWPRYKTMLPLGIFLGLAFGVGLAFLLEFMDTSVKTPSDVTRRVDLPLLAMVPHADDMDHEVEDFRRAFLAGGGEVDSLLAESFRELRTNLLFSGPAEKIRTLLVTSPSPDDGRTSVAVSMAVAIANGGRRVLLVDANFRRPALQAVFGELDSTGLSDVLSAQRPWTECVRATEVTGLSVMASGKLPPNPNELLGGELAAKVISEMAGQYDQVIFDGPPLLLITDAAVLSTRVDGVVLVVRAGVNTHGIVTRCRQNLARIGAHVLGVVLNGVRATAGGYLQKNYDAFYEYQENDGEHEAPAEAAEAAKA